MLNPEFVTVVADGIVYSGFEKVEVKASIKEACRTFTIETTERPGQFSFPPGTAIQILSNGNLLVDGFVNQYRPSGDAETHRISISGRSKGQDFVDSSADHPTGEWDDADPATVAKDLAKPYGVDIRPMVQVEKVPRWAIAQGETAFQSLERMLRPQGVTLMGAADGAIEMTNATAAKVHFGILMEGSNIKEYSGTLSDQGRHKNYKVRGQRRLGAADTDLEIEETATDSGGKRNRTKILVNETDTDPNRARNRAMHEKERCAGRSISCEITTQGFRDFAGQVFEPNHLIYVHSPILLHISQTMLIESVTLSQHFRQGSLAHLNLVDPRTYKGQKTGEGETDSAYTEGY